MIRRRALIPATLLAAMGLLVGLALLAVACTRSEGAGPSAVTPGQERAVQTYSGEDGHSSAREAPAVAESTHEDSQVHSEEATAPSEAKEEDGHEDGHPAVLAESGDEDSHVHGKEATAPSEVKEEDGHQAAVLAESGDEDIHVHGEEATAPSEAKEEDGHDHEAAETAETQEPPRVALRRSTTRSAPLGPLPEAKEEDGHDHGHSQHGAEQAVIEGAREVVLVATEFAFEPSTITVKQGEPVTLVLVNKGVIEHEVELPAFHVHLHTLVGETQKGSFIPDQVGTFEFACEIPGHRESGMVGTLVVEPSPGT